MTRDESPTFIFHIGLERTGSTSFQRFCTINAALLRQCGLLYPTKTLAFRVDNHGPLVAGYLDPRYGSPDFAIRSGPAPTHAVLRSLFKEVARHAPECVLISSEHFSSRFEPAEIAALAQDFAERKCKILVVLRDHRERFFSAYATSIMSGRHLTIEEYAEEVLAPANQYFRYQTIIESWGRVFGEAAIVVTPYRSDGRLIQTLLDTVLPRPAMIPVDDSYRDNRSLSPSCTEALRLANHALASRFDGNSARPYWSWLQKRYCEVRIKRWLVAAAGSPRHEAWHLSAANLERLDAIAATDAAWLTASYGIKLATPNTPTATEPAQNALNATEILARALQDRILGQWNLVDAAMPALIPMVRLWHRWRMKGL